MELRICCIILGVLFHLNSLGQISFVEETVVSKNNPLLKNEAQLYDSLTNICPINGSYKHLVNQDVVFYGSSKIEELYEKYGFGFYSEKAWGAYLKSMSGKFKIIEKMSFLPFLKKKFEILDMDTLTFKNKTYSVTKRFMKLKDEQTGSIVFYRFDDSFVNSLWTVVGYVEKAKQLYMDKYFILKKYIANNPFYSSSVDNPDSRWKCVDVSLKIQEHGVMSNVVLNLSNMDNPSDNCYEYLDDLKKRYLVKMFSYAEIERISKVDKRIEDSIRIVYLKNLYGNENAIDIFHGNVRLGFTQAMCREAWGSPSSRNVTQGEWGIHEQWVYSRRKSYLYFENGILSAIQY